MKKDNPASDVPPNPDPDHPLHFPAKKPEEGTHPVTPPKPEHKPESKEAVAAALKEAAAAPKLEPPALAVANFNESQFTDAGNGWVYVIVKSPVPVYYGPGFPLPNQKFPYHGTDPAQAGKPVRDGDCKLTVKPGGAIAAQPVEEASGGWQFFWKQNGVVFCVPDDHQAFGFIYKAK